ncbi:MAG: hypothetical protein A2113_02735 [Candidatus Woykebacteria bacterium GWA1_44_8]|uniref:NodB homology domain-containing protein n=1 Tax=Candidatus Woykebacteria bacterium GWA1_44_8 TaxID=1802591 RepID=A0A1G1W3E3_9BACT|nr:MAG: hypothetical protein A2113_02735 [Candidatus Woykebacteria bacterium GWA1_44_8]
MKEQGIKLVVSLLLILWFWWASSLAFSRSVMAQTTPANPPAIVEQNCSLAKPGKITVTFRWQPAGSGPQWLDISLFNNGFASGTFVGIGPFPAQTSSFTWDGLTPGKMHYFRVNTITPSGWQPTPVLPFMTGQCAPGSSPGFYYLECSKTQPGRVAVTFRWQPSGKGSQWLDISLYANGFASGTFIGVGPFPAQTNSFTWNGLIPARMHYFRVNTQTLGGWEANQTVAFFSGRCSSADKTPLGGGNKIVLTFDDCGNPYVGTVRILDILARYQAKALLFPTGACVQLVAPDVFDRAMAEGHLMGNHTWNHVDITALSEEQLRFQIANGPPQAVGGYFRPPYGAHNSYTDAVAAELGYTP